MIFVPIKKGCSQQAKQRKKILFLQIIIGVETYNHQSNI
jgi:hypothetical protein